MNYFVRTYKNYAPFEPDPDGGDLGSFSCFEQTSIFLVAQY